jgi:hypothetical protein
MCLALHLLVSWSDVTISFPMVYPHLHFLDRKGMDAQHCGVLVKTYNIFKMQKLMFIKTQDIF